MAHSPYSGQKEAPKMGAKVREGREALLEETGYDPEPELNES